MAPHPMLVPDPFTLAFLVTGYALALIAIGVGLPLVLAMLFQRLAGRLPTSVFGLVMLAVGFCLNADSAAVIMLRLSGYVWLVWGILSVARPRAPLT